MQFRLDNEGRQLISRYGEGLISVNGADYTSSLIVSGEGVVAPWFDGDPTTLGLEDFRPLLDLEPEVRPDIVLLGTGSRHVFPRPELLVALRRQGIALEVMDTRAACRTYSVLVSEDRKVAAALMPIH